jgi:hypothetical protein
MKKLFIVLGFVTFLAFKMADVFSDLGITKQQAEEFLSNSLSNGSLYYPRSASKIPMANRVSIVQALGGFAKSYLKTDDFKNRYAEWWKDKEPTKPETPEARIAREKAEQAKSTIDAEQGQKEMVQNLKKQIAETKDPALKKQLEEVLKTSIEMQAQVKKQLENAEFKAQMKQAEEMSGLAYAEEYKELLQKYNADFADWKAIQNPNVLIKQRLSRFLEISSSVDFSAELKTENGRKKFVKEEYEQKDEHWRRCYRAGKPAVDAARIIAQEWLKEI